MYDPRWNPIFLFSLLFGQAVSLAITLALVLTPQDSVGNVDWTDYNEHEYIYYTIYLDMINLGPLALSSASLLSVLVHIVCFFAKSLHPLVVLSRAIDMMVAWAVVVSYGTVLYSLHAPKPGGFPQTMAMLIFSGLNLLLYVVLVGYATKQKNLVAKEVARSKESPASERSRAELGTSEVCSMVETA